VFFDKARNGLLQTWRYPTVFANPPGGYDDDHSSIQEKCVNKIVGEYEAEHFQEGVFLLRVALCTVWFNSILTTRPICLLFLPVRFNVPGGQQASKPSPHSYCFLYLGKRPHRFATIFASIGHVINLPSDLPPDLPGGSDHPLSANAVV
jgi:hypothetical protein